VYALPSPTVIPTPAIFSGAAITILFVVTVEFALIVTADVAVHEVVADKVKLPETANEPVEVNVQVAPVVVRL
jgi:hypothetical protein